MEEEFDKQKGQKGSPETGKRGSAQPGQRTLKNPRQRLERELDQAFEQAQTSNQGPISGNHPVWKLVRNRLVALGNDELLEQTLSGNRAQQASELPSVVSADDAADEVVRQIKQLYLEGQLFTARDIVEKAEILLCELLNTVPQWFIQWQQGNGEACRDTIEWLWERLYDPVREYLTRISTIDNNLAEGFVADGFWNTMEKLDLEISGGEILVSSSFFERGDFKDPVAILVKIKDGRNSLTDYIRKKMPERTWEMLKLYDSSSEPSKRLQDDVVDVFNQLVQDVDLYLFMQVDAVMCPCPQGKDLTVIKQIIDYNRSLLEAAFPNELLKVGDRKEFKAWGIISRRKLRLQEEQKSIQWRGKTAFVALARRICGLCCWHRVRDWDPIAAECLALVQEAEEDEKGSISEEKIPAKISGPECWVFNKDGLVTFVRTLIRASAQLGQSPALRKTVEKIIFFVKWKVARYGQKIYSPQEIDKASIAALVEEAENRSDKSFMSGFEFDRVTWRKFLMNVLFRVPTDEEKINKAGNFLQMAQPQADLFGGNPLNCDQVQSNLNLLLKSKDEFEKKFGPERLAQILFHIAICNNCQLALGGAIITRRHRNNLDQRIKRILPLLIAIYKEVNKPCQN